MAKQPTDFRGKERRNRSRSGRTLAERRLDYWRQLERLGTKVVTEHASLLPDELLTHHQGLEARIAEFEVYLDALRTTIAAEETGFRDYENKFLERLERERKKRKQLRARIHQDRPDQDALARQITLGEEELEILERRIADEEAKSAGEVHAALRELRLDRIRRQRRMDKWREELKAARRQDEEESDPRLLEIDQQIAQLEGQLHEQEQAIDGRLAEHQENLRTYSEQLTALRDDLRDHLIKVGDAILHHQLGGGELVPMFERLRRMIREAVR